MSYNKTIQAKLYRYFTDRLGLKPSTKGFLRGDCPYCGGKFTFGVNIETTKVNCFKNCHHHFSPLRVLRHIEGFNSQREVQDFLKLQQEYESYESMLYAPPPRADYKKMALPPGYTPVDMGDDLYATSARAYLKGRGFKLKDLVYRGVGYCNEGMYDGYIIFPIYSGGELVFFQGRLYLGFGPKMKNPPEEEFGVGKTKVIYNRDALFLYDQVYITESITNSITMGQRSIATLGKKPSPYQVSDIIKAPCKEVIILYDPDALKEAIQLSLTLVNYKRVKLVYWEGEQDVNDLGRAKVKELIRQFPFSNYNQLITLKNQLM